MLLAVDVGNTQTVLGLYRNGSRPGDEPLLHYRIATDHTATSDELRVKLSALLTADGHGDEVISCMALASVVPELTGRWERVARHLGIDPLIVSALIETGLDVDYENPREIGADRIADAVAAIGKYGAPVIVVDLGTATNIEVIDGDGRFAGGIIAPGFETSANALFDAAARIARFDIELPPSVVGKSTRTAVQSGLLYGEVARIDGLVDRVIDELGTVPTVVATGGLAPRVAPLSKRIDYVDSNLTIEGLLSLYLKNRKEGS